MAVDYLDWFEFGEIQCHGVCVVFGFMGLSSYLMASSRSFMFFLWVCFLLGVSSSLIILPVSTRYFVPASLLMLSSWYRVRTLCFSSSGKPLLIITSIGLEGGYLSVFSFPSIFYPDYP